MGKLAISPSPFSHSGASRVRLRSSNGARCPLSSSPLYTHFPAKTTPTPDEKVRTMEDGFPASDSRLSSFIMELSQQARSHLPI